MDLRQRLKQLHIEDPRQRKREIAWLWRRIRQHRNAVATISIMSLTGIVLGMCSSVASKRLIDSITSLDLPGTVSSAGLFAALLLGSILLGNISAQKTAKLRINMRNELQQKVFVRILGARWESLEGIRSGDMLNLLSADVTAVSDPACWVTCFGSRVPWALCSIMIP